MSKGASGQICYIAGGNRQWYFKVGSWSLNAFDNLPPDDRRVVVFALNELATDLPPDRYRPLLVTADDLKPILAELDTWSAAMTKAALQALEGGGGA